VICKYIIRSTSRYGSNSCNSALKGNSSSVMTAEQQGMVGTVETRLDSTMAKNTVGLVQLMPATIDSAVGMVGLPTPRLGARGGATFGVSNHGVFNANHTHQPLLRHNIIPMYD
jgi:hypothetical protein